MGPTAQTSDRPARKLRPRHQFKGAHRDGPFRRRSPDRVRSKFAGQRHKHFNQLESMNTSYPFDLSPATATAPCNLDPIIEREHRAPPLGDSDFRWYRGADSQGVIHVFRFQRGGSVENWQHGLRSQQLVDVSGPFRAKSQALIATPAAACA